MSYIFSKFSMSLIRKSYLNDSLNVCEFTQHESDTLSVNFPICFNEFCPPFDKCTQSASVNLPQSYQIHPACFSALAQS